MKHTLWMALLLCALVLPATGQAGQGKGKKNEYVVLTSREVAADPAWNKVALALAKKHRATILRYDRAPGELAVDLKRLRPRYVAIVEKPERLNRDFIIETHRASRAVDEDIFADFLWGVITGYDAAAAMKMVDNSTRPLVVKNAVATITELREAKWFDRYAWVDDHEAGLWGEKTGKGEAVRADRVPREQVLRKFTDLYAAYDPDLVVTAAHATEKNLEMPFSLGNLKARDGRLHAEDRFTRETWDLVESGKRKIYFAVGNCLIGNVNATAGSMAVAWMNSGNAATMIGYVVPTWHGRNGWGGLKYWLATPGRYSLAEAIFLNQQDFLFQGSQWHPLFASEPYPHERGPMSGANALANALGKQPTKDQLGFWHDRDVLAYYGDPRWDARLQEVEGESDFTVTSRREKKRCTITVKTGETFSMKRLAGDNFKAEHVLDIPFSYFFPERLVNPRLAPGQAWRVALDENFLLLYDPGFEPAREYTIVLDVD
jgi:zinc protease